MRKNRFPCPRFTTLDGKRWIIKKGVRERHRVKRKLRASNGKGMSAQSSVGTPLVHVPLKLHLSFSVMNNDNNAFSHQLMTTFVLGQLPC
jgi:hypothetical protein